MTFLQILLAEFAAAFVIAFAIGWLTKEQSRAYKRGMTYSLLLVFLPSCEGMFHGSPVEQNRAAEGFFFLLFPSLIGCVIAAFTGIIFARVIRWKE